MTGGTIMAIQVSPGGNGCGLVSPFLGLDARRFAKEVDLKNDQDAHRQPKGGGYERRIVLFETHGDLLIPEAPARGHIYRVELACRCLRRPAHPESLPGRCPAGAEPGR